jgi:hypothetical protein
VIGACVIAGVLAEWFTPGGVAEMSSPVQKFERFVGLLLLGLAALGAMLVGLSAATIFRTPGVDESNSTIMLGVWKLLYDTSAPPPVVIVGAAGLGLLLAAAVALVERRVATRARRSEDAQRLPSLPSSSWPRPAGTTPAR